MIITEEFLKSLNPCQDGYEYWVNTNKPDLGEFMRQCVQDGHWCWAWWLLKRSVPTRFLAQVGVFSAKSVLHIFEKRYPDDNRVRACIESTEKFMTGQIGKDEFLRVRENAYAASANAAYAYASANAAAAASYAAYAAYAADAANAAADAADYAAAYAASYADYAANASAYAASYAAKADYAAYDAAYDAASYAANANADAASYAAADADANAAANAARKNKQIEIVNFVMSELKSENEKR